MRQNWNRSYDATRVYEGGNVDDPNDNGGRTSRGVTQRVYDAFRVHAGLHKKDVFNASDDEIERIYFEQYWHPSRCDDLPSGVDFIVFDIAVNSGVKRAYKLLQSALNARGHDNVLIDGSPGMVTVSAAQTDDDHDALIAEIGNKRLAFYKALKDWKHYKGGWTKRNKNCVAIAQAWASGSVGPAPVPAGGKKAPDTKVAKAPIAPSTGTAVTGSATTGAAGIEILKEQLDTAQSTVQSVVPYLEIAQYAVVAIIFVGVGLTFYSLYRNFKAREALDARAA